MESLPLDPVKNKFQGETPLLPLMAQLETPLLPLMARLETPLLPLMARLETPLPPDRIRPVPVPTPFDIPPPLLYNSKVI